MRRGGRLTPGQQRAFDQYWDRFGIDFEPGKQIDAGKQFGNDHPLCLEIGFGNGESLADMAQRHPETNYLGIEVHEPGVGHLLLRLAEQGIQNVRIMKHDAMEILSTAIEPASLASVQLFFPDPWHKKKHHKRRIVQAKLVALLARAMEPNGVFHAATDWENYARHMMSVLSEHDDVFENTAGRGQFIPRPDDRPLTKFEQRGQRLGHGVWDLKFRRL